MYSNQTNVKNQIVLNQMMSTMDIINTDVQTASFTQPVIPSIQNTATQMVSPNGSNYSSCFTTFQLSPTEGHIMSIDDAFLHFQFDMSFTYTLSAQTAAGSSPVRIAVGFRDTAALFNQLTLKIGNMTIWNTTYHHLESAISFAALPSDVVEGDPQYATIDKLLEGKPTPMAIMNLPVNGAVGPNTISLKFDITVDLNRLCVPLSNIHYLAKNMGTFNLQVYMQNLHKSMYVMYIPAVGDSTHVCTLEPINWGVAMPIIPAATHFGDNNTTGITADRAATSITFSLPAASFFACNVAEICQKCFSISYDSYLTLCNYFAASGKIILPSNILTTNQFNNGTILTGAIRTNTSYLASISGGNINKVFCSFCPDYSNNAIVNILPTSMQLSFGGVPVNYLTYDSVGSNRTITDMVSSLIDTDHDRINKDYLNGLSFPIQNQLLGNVAAQSMGEYTTYQLANLNNYAYTGTNISSQYLKNPTLCPYVWSTALDGTFHTGLAPDGTTQSSQIRLTLGSVALPLTGGNDYYTSTINATNSFNMFVTTFNDCCFVLDYNEADDTVYNASLSYLAPWSE